MIADLTNQAGNLKESPPLPCGTRSVEHMFPYVGLARRLTTFGQCRRAGHRLRLIPSSFLITVQGLLPITNRAGKLFLQRATELIRKSARRGFYSSEIFKYIFQFLAADACVSGRRGIKLNFPLPPSAGLFSHPDFCG